MSPSKRRKKRNHAEEFSEDEIQIVKRILIERISSRPTSQHLLPSFNSAHGEHQKTLTDLITRLVENGESSSVLIVGSRGVGKSTLLNCAMEGFIKYWNDENSSSSQPFYKVYLNGLVHSDDRKALQDIIRQLSAESKVEESVISGGSFADSLSMVFSSLQEGTLQSKPILCILDEFDQFAHQHKQTLLYNLFNHCQVGGTPLLVVGLTCRMDVLELLEKRVKSRFSHRQLYLFPNSDLESFTNVLKEYLTLHKQSEISSSYRSAFNESVNAMFKQSKFKHFIEDLFNLSRDVSSFFRICLTAILSLCPENPILEQSEIVSFYENSFKVDSKTQLLQGITELQMCFLISASKLIENEVDIINFETIFHEYKRQMERIRIDSGGAGSMEICSKKVALKAFEELIELEAFYLQDKQIKTRKEYRIVVLNLVDQQIKNILELSVFPSYIKKLIK